MSIQNNTNLIKNNNALITAIKEKVNAYAPSVGVKLFETVEALNNDATIVEGDKAVVYDVITRIHQTGDSFRYLKFPANIVLPEVYTATNTRGYIRGVLVSETITISPTAFAVSPLGVTYTSEDGITYTRTDAGNEIMDLGEYCTLTVGTSYMNDLIPYFLTLVLDNFTGFYKAESGVDSNSFRMCPITGISFEIISQPTMTGELYPEYYDLAKIRAILSNIIADKGYSVNYMKMYLDSNKIPHLAITEQGGAYVSRVIAVCCDENLQSKGLSIKETGDVESTTIVIRDFTLDVDAGTYVDNGTFSPTDRGVQMLGVNALTHFVIGGLDVASTTTQIGSLSYSTGLSFGNEEIVRIDRPGRWYINELPAIDFYKSGLFYKQVG